MNWVKQLTENKTFLLSLWVAICFGLFVNGINSFISSSEFWSIYLSQKILSFDPSWSSVYLKPLFHLILSSVYLLNLNDFYHIYAVKILFSLNGVLQFFLIFRILNLVQRQNFYSLVLSVFLFCSPFYLDNYDRVRSDQLALTFTLLFLLNHLSNLELKNWISLFLITLIPCIAIKHIYFVVICLPFLPYRFFKVEFFKLNVIRRLICCLIFINLFIFGLYFSIPAFAYWLNSIEENIYSTDILLWWMKKEWLYLYLSTLPFFLKKFRIFLSKKNLERLSLVQIFIFFLISIHPQKFDFFIASFLPILYLPGLLFLIFLNSENAVAFKKVLPALFIVFILVFYIAKKDSRFFSLNNPQLIAIDRISNIVTKNNLSYLDGMGILPKGNNLGCFVSPNDDLANSSCILSIENKVPDVIIVTNRLMSLKFDFNSLEKFGYIGVGPNFFIKAHLINITNSAMTDWPPPSLIFTTSQIY